jgi:hypothetical protein
MNTRLASAAAVVGLMLLGLPAASRAQPPAGADASARAGATEAGSIRGVVRNERGVPMAGAMVSALGASRGFALTDEQGRFELRALPPGAYVVRAHLNGYTTSPVQTLQVESNATAVSTIALSRARGTAPLLAAGVGAAAEPRVIESESGDATGDADARDAPQDDHGETAWRIRHARRPVLKDLEDTALAELVEPEPTAFAPEDFLRSIASPARLATSFFASTPFSGQVNLLTTSSFEAPEDLFTAEHFARGTAYVRVGAPIGSRADWTVRGALSQADISSWILAGSYATRAPAQHAYNVGLSYSTQRYDGGNPLAVREVKDGSRNVAEMFGFDTFAVTPSFAVTYGARYGQYDYLDDRILVSPRLEVTLTPAARTRVRTSVARREHAPGAEEFLPPSDTGIWLPPQRTFSALDPGRPLEAERSTRVAVAIERDAAMATVSIQGFHERVDGQLLTLLGADLPGQPTAKVGHYFVGSAGDATATGCTAEVRAAWSSRVRGSVAYSLTRAALAMPGDPVNLLLLAPSAIRPAAENVHDVSTAIETNVPETSTRVLVLYRMGNAFARQAASAGEDDTGGRLDSRFDVQVRQSLPFLNFTSARWEMLLAVRNFFRDAASEQTVFDELLVLRPPKRIVGGVTMHF